MEIPNVLSCGKPARQGKGNGCVVFCLLVKEILLKNLWCRLLSKTNQRTEMSGQ